MKQAQKNKVPRRLITIRMGHRLREGILLVSIALAMFLMVSFVSYHSTDPGWSSTGVGNQVLNWGGRIGAFFADVFLSIFGFIAYLLPPMIVLAAWLGVRESSDATPTKTSELIFKLLGFLLVLFSNCGLITLFFRQETHFLPTTTGGILGDLIAVQLTHVLNPMGSVLLLMTALLCGTTLFAGISWLGVIDRIGSKVTNLFEELQKVLSKKSSPKTVNEIAEPLLNLFQEKIKSPAKPKIAEPKMIEPTLLHRQLPTQPVKNKAITPSVTLSPGMLPPLTLLNAPPPPSGKAFSNLNFEELSQLVEQRLLDFGVATKVVAVHPGPVITRFELDLAAGVKVSKISGLAKDIARSLSVTSVRVVEVIPGKSVIGLELPNEHRELVCLRDILESPRYGQSSSPLSLALGKDIAGFPIVVDLAKMPHLLVAGTTGAGKSVSLNGMILSMLFKATPEQLRIIMIDPKMLELSVYEGIPHLLTPVITDMKDAANALRWCVAEMDRRYKLMSALGVRNLAGYNFKLIEAVQEGNPIPTPAWLMAMGNQPPTLQPLPMIVVVADELADMMMVVGKKVEELVTRIAQKARAAGIHLILATQRPSVDVITGLIKANIPTRIAFQVSSRIDSRTILDQQGAEQLLGNGDMLYLPPGTGVPVRVHGAYVADEEVHRVVAAWQTYAKPVYLEEVVEAHHEESGGDTEQGSGEADPLYDEALRIVTESRRASISLVQRRLRIGYNRAARIMEDMELAGVVSAMDHSGSREVLAAAPPLD
ncbi:MAG: cell division protein FtsK [Gammaproteobacteria bacterium]|nr:cell division protein FtsK [Gammaproteobacteria bacterium]MCE3237768.1 cell division protein FtsK [Gammaproteobacteria bacterium]